MLTHKEKCQILCSIVWDYQVDGEKLLEVLTGFRETEGPFNQEKLFLRMLERLPWHDILGLVGIEFVKHNLIPQRIAKLHLPQQRNRYERIRKILHGEPLSFSGWNPRHRQKYQSTLLSNRWHRTK